MNREVAKQCTELSDKEQITFPQVVGQLIEAKIELYYADLLIPNKTFYAQNQAYTVDCFIENKTDVARTFYVDGVKSAIKLIQTGKIQYQEFLKKIMEAGVICYMVFLSGRKAIYFGRKGEQHIEEFPK